MLEGLLAGAMLVSGNVVGRERKGTKRKNMKKSQIVRIVFGGSY